MAENRPLTILVLGYSRTQITFLNRLIRGLAARHMTMLIASHHPRQIKRAFPEGVRALRTVPIKGFPPLQMLHCVRLGILCLFSKRRRWLASQVRRAEGLKNKWGTFLRYAPFCQADFDVVYFPWNSSAISYRGMFELGKPAVISCRGSQVNIRPLLPGQADYAAGLRETLHKAAAVHCVSADIQRSAQVFGLDPRRSTIIRPAVDPGFFQPPGVPPHNRRFRLVTTGSLIWRKGYEFLLMALKKLVSAGVDAELHILGQGPLHQQVLFTIQDLGLAERVHLHGRVTPLQVLAQLQACDAFVLSSLSEGLSNAVLEAMSCGLSVVTTDCGGMAEGVSDGVEGFLVPLRDPTAMAAALGKLAADPALRARMGQAGRARVLAAFQLDQQVQDFMALFQSVSRS